MKSGEQAKDQRNSHTYKKDDRVLLLHAIQLPYCLITRRYREETDRQRQTDRQKEIMTHRHSPALLANDMQISRCRKSDGIGRERE